ncbi:PKD domain-containing protein [Haloarcula sp. S1CR25-12]|uniref:PKD domain-containing protein n=1 Tax=Haloarcula saliterrae TaxID=2950534 RepID=A0ABU2FEJ0_9EURY|nr:PKD domain-containing protein [Haloarcula sp. S1CR25-12]MDS0260667.1 PKD domain-containing protein [Haloarcula sp. S1CR25-12]
MRVATLVALVSIGLLAATGGVVAAENTAPLADAGVDQTVPANTTVHLDANGTVDPDGEVAGVSWTIETPGGDTTSPACPDCRRTEFDADDTGQYTVTLTVTDDDGATRSDTLYVTVTNATGPAVTLSGPGVTLQDSNTTFEANVSRDNAPLQTLAWVVDGEVVHRQSLDGATANTSFSHSFTNTSTMAVRAVVYDTLGNRGSATWSVKVVEGGGGGSGVGGSTCASGGCSGADKIVTGPDGQDYVLDTNGEDGIQLNSGDGADALTDYGDNLQESGDLRKTVGGAYKVTEGQALSDITTEAAETNDPMNDDNTGSDYFVDDDGDLPILDDDDSDDSFNQFDPLDFSPGGPSENGDSSEGSDGVLNNPLL